MQIIITFCLFLGFSCVIFMCQCKKKLVSLKHSNKSNTENSTDHFCCFASVMRKQVNYGNIGNAHAPCHVTGWY